MSLPECLLDAAVDLLVDTLELLGLLSLLPLYLGQQDPEYVLHHVYHVVPEDLDGHGLLLAFLAQPCQDPLEVHIQKLLLEDEHVSSQVLVVVGEVSDLLLHLQYQLLVLPSLTSLLFESQFNATST